MKENNNQEWIRCNNLRSNHPEDKREHCLNKIKKLENNERGRKEMKNQTQSVIGGQRSTIPELQLLIGLLCKEKIIRRKEEKKVITHNFFEKTTPLTFLFSQRRNKSYTQIKTSHLISDQITR